MTLDRHDVSVYRLDVLGVGVQSVDVVEICFLLSAIKKRIAAW
jgi:hypothetical protein